MRSFKDDNDERLYVTTYKNDSLDELFDTYLWLDAEDLEDIETEISFGLELPTTLTRLIYRTGRLRTKIINNLYREDSSEQLDIEEFYILILLCMGYYVLRVKYEKSGIYKYFISDEKSDLNNINKLKGYINTTDKIKTQLLEP